jgi:hypothetical protein
VSDTTYVGSEAVLMAKSSPPFTHAASSRPARTEAMGADTCCEKIGWAPVVMVLEETVIDRLEVQNDRGWRLGWSLYNIFR